MATSHDVLVIGGGPGGYVAAIKAAQYGLNVGCIEMEKVLGGTCLRIGCIPSKGLLESTERLHQAQNEFADHGINVSSVKVDLAKMHARKDKTVGELARGIDELFRRSKITRYLGVGRFLSPSKVTVVGTGEEIQAKHVIIATGSKSATLPGIELDGERVGTSTEALNYPEVPKEMIVIGAGAIGLELGSVWQRLGAKVTVLEYLDRILPEMDDEIAASALRIFTKQGIIFKLGSRVTSAKKDGRRAIVTCDGAPPMSADRVLVSVGRTPNTEGLGLEVIGIETDKRGRIPTNEHFQTTVPGVYAIGDVIAGPMLAHKAEDEGAAVAEFIATGYGHVNYMAIPSVVYTSPEIASVGFTEKQLQEKEIPFKKGKFPFIANGRAKVLGDTSGMVKVLAHAETDRLLGVHIINNRAGDLIAEATAAIEFAATAEDVARTTHAHPTLPEAIKEAAMAVHNQAIHM
ncbi:dihydrolipoyl dehydrogenase [bacterium]|jgi:dihydrolipoamide dehydrogenase|nr:dihydrolipoyl dehydrogenase [bacterium]